MAFRASTNATTGAGTATSLACNKPVGTVNGDVLTAGVCYGSLGTITPPAGWTEVFDSGSFGGSGRQLKVYTKLASGEPASWTWSFSAAVGIVIEVGAFDTRTSASPNASGGQVNGISANCTAPSISPAATNCDLVGYFAADSGRTFTAPGGMTEREDQSAGSRALALMTEVLVSNGATGTRVSAMSGNAVNSGWLGAFAPTGGTVRNKIVYRYANLG